MRVWDKESIQDLLKVNDAAVARAILALYARQTSDEQSGERTNVSNGMGFNQHDAPFLTSVAKALPRWNNHMTPKQLATARRMLPKYWRQLAEVANERVGEPSAAPVVAAQETQRAQANRNFGRF